MIKNERDGERIYVVRGRYISHQYRRVFMPFRLTHEGECIEYCLRGNPTLFRKFSFLSPRERVKSLKIFMSEIIYTDRKNDDLM